MHKYIRSRCNYLHRTTNHPLAEVTQHPMRPRKNTNSLLWQRKTNRSLDLRIPSNCCTTEPLTKPLLVFASLDVNRRLSAFITSVAAMQLMFVRMSSNVCVWMSPTHSLDVAHAFASRRTRRVRLEHASLVQRDGASLRVARRRVESSAAGGIRPVALQQPR